MTVRQASEVHIDHEAAAVVVVPEEGLGRPSADERPRPWLDAWRRSASSRRQHAVDGTSIVELVRAHA